MKPPTRVRAAPQRYSGQPGAAGEDGVDGEDGEAEAWCHSERQQLLRALGRQSARGTLDMPALVAAVPTRSPQEVLGYVESLCLRSERSALQKVYNQRRQEQHHRQQQHHAPLQIWTELAETVTGRLDEVIATAVSQTLVIAATEPVCGAAYHEEEGEGRGPVMPVAGSRWPALHTDTLTDTHKDTDTDTHTDTDTDTHTDTDAGAECAAVYRFLSAAVRGTPLPPLPAQASLLLRELLHSLPVGVVTLRGRPLSPRLRGSAARLQRPHRPPPPGAPATPRAHPLNPFTVPLGLLVEGGQRDPPPQTQG